VTTFADCLTAFAHRAEDARNAASVNVAFGALADRSAALDEQRRSARAGAILLAEAFMRLGNGG